MNWRLRKSDGTIYGPVAFPEFYRWAAEGRILPDDFVAEGEGEWTPAPDVAALELDWMLSRGEGRTLGPLHLLAFAELLQQRMLRGDEPIVKKSGGDSIPVGQAVAAELLCRINAILNELATARVDLRAARLALAQRKESPDSISRAEFETARRGAEQLLARASELEMELTTLRNVQSGVSVELEQLRDMAREQTQALDSAKAELAQSREELARAEHRIRELEEAARTPAPEPFISPRPEILNAEGREKEFQDLTRRYERLLARTREEAERNDAIQKALETERSAAAARQSETEERLRAAQEQIAALKSRVEEQDRSHEELVREFRELNDRYIRLRADKEVAGGGQSPKPKVRLV